MVFYIDRKLVELYCVWGRGTCGQWAGCLETLITQWVRLDHSEGETGWLIDRNVECWELEECGAWMNWIKRSAFPCKENHKVPKMPCIVFVVEKLNWTQLHEETGLRIEACGWDRIEIDGTEGFKLCQGYPSQEGGSFLPQEETFWILKQIETLCYLLTVYKLSMSLCLSPLCIFDKVPSRKEKRKSDWVQPIRPRL